MMMVVPDRGGVGRRGHGGRRRRRCGRCGGDAGGGQPRARAARVRQQHGRGRGPGRRVRQRHAAVDDGEVGRALRAAAAVGALERVPRGREVGVDAVLRGQALLEPRPQLPADLLEAEHPHDADHGVAEHEQEQGEPVHVEQFLVQTPSSETPCNIHRAPVKPCIGNREHTRVARVAYRTVDRRPPRANFDSNKRYRVSDS